MLDEIIGQRPQKSHGVLTELARTHDELDVPHGSGGVGYQQRVGQYTDVAFAAQQRSQLVGRGARIQKNGIAFVDVLHTLGRDALLFGHIDLIFEADAAFKQRAAVQHCAAVFQRNHAILSHRIQIPPDGHGGHLNTLCQVGDYHTAVALQFIQNIAFSFDCLHSISSPGLPWPLLHHFSSFFTRSLPLHPVAARARRCGSYSVRCQCTAHSAAPPGLCRPDSRCGCIPQAAP